MVLCNIRIPTLTLLRVIFLVYLSASINIVPAAPVDERIGTLQSIHARSDDPRQQQSPISPRDSLNHQDAAHLYWFRLFAIFNERLERKVATYRFQMKQKDGKKDAPERFQKLTLFWTFIINEHEAFQRLGFNAGHMQHLFADAENMQRDGKEPPGAFILTKHRPADRSPLSRPMVQVTVQPASHRQDIIWNRELNALYAIIVKSVAAYRYWEAEMQSDRSKAPPKAFLYTSNECWDQIIKENKDFIQENKREGRQELAEEWGKRVAGEERLRLISPEPPLNPSTYSIMKQGGSSPEILFSAEIRVSPQVDLHVH